LREYTEVCHNNREGLAAEDLRWRNLGVQDNASITPVISETSANFIEGLVEDAKSKGAKLLQEYKREKNLIWPLLIDHVTQVGHLLIIMPHVQSKVLYITRSFFKANNNVFHAAD
jgi:Aldehyde dehydrogenase family